MFIYSIWEQTYHNKALNFSPKKKKSIKFIPYYKALNFSPKKYYIHTSIHFYMFYFGANMSQQNIKLFTKKKH